MVLTKVDFDVHKNRRTGFVDRHREWEFDDGIDLKPTQGKSQPGDGVAEGGLFDAQTKVC